ncbi:hypothetical protein CCAX7_10760 [Capsulimonas corticalis]|uniref:Uncharacterized protein n=1 Tax=Capsulimonas corticalis TaxID=2219043 RepID=A0A402CUM4_9BACT|nr:hypothetical protein [Capsulimonas corticalis]BDI29025.1 hypothetical protein CCAX7_10760 [Capsulimonas corticalis]
MTGDNTGEIREKLGWGSALAIAGAALLIAGIVWGVPFLARRAAAGDLSGVPAQTASGSVRDINVAVGHAGGGGMHNAVTLEFAHRKVFYILPETSRWIPVIGEPVLVRYRVGRNSGVAQIDSVTSTSPAAKWAPPLRKS